MTRGSVVLVADGNVEDAGRIRQSLATRRIECRLVQTGRAAWEAAAERTPALLLSEMVLPDMTGLGLCRLMRESPALRSVPIAMVTGYAAEIDRVIAFEAGVDDFVPKPFFPAELAARVRAILRAGARRSAAAESGSSPVSLDPRRREALVDGRRVNLSLKEFGLLAALVRCRGRVLERRALIERAWGARGPGERAVDSHIKAIRRKLGDAGGCVETVRGKGYRFNESHRS